MGLQEIANYLGSTGSEYSVQWWFLLAVIMKELFWRSAENGEAWAQ